MARTLVEHEQALSLPRWTGWRRYRIPRAGRSRGRARKPEVWAAVDQYPDGWRFELCSWRAVDRRAPQDSVAHDHAQQSRISRGGNVCATDGGTAESWC